MLPVQLTYGNEGFKEIQEFLKQNYHKDYTLEQEANWNRLQDLMLVMRRTDEHESDVRTFMREIRKYAAIKELDEAVLNRLVSKIMVGEVRKVDGQRFQKVRIVYNFVGEIIEK